MGKSTGEERPEYMKTYKTRYKKKKHQVNVALDAEEFKKLEIQASELHLKPSTLARQLLQEKLSGHGRTVVHVPEVNQEMAKELIRLMRTMANNFNQMAYHMNLSSQLEDRQATINPETAITSMHKQVKDMEITIKETLTQYRTDDY